MSEVRRRYVGIPDAGVYVHWSGAESTRGVEALRHIVYHSPTGLSWGYGGSGPADLALSLLADHLGERGRIPRQYEQDPRYFRAVERTVAWRLHQQLKWDVVSCLPQEQPWQIADAELDRWLLELRQRGDVNEETRTAARLALLQPAVGRRLRLWVEVQR